jgi:hypothetical protein
VNDTTIATGDDSETPDRSETVENNAERRVFEALPDAGSEEAAAIAAAIGTYLRREELAAASEDIDRGWEEPGRQWAFAGRMRGVGGRSVRVPEDCPTDPWTAAGRTDRMR